jgi:hypothetical protein
VLYRTAKTITSAARLEPNAQVATLQDTSASSIPYLISWSATASLEVLLL